jgi:hypothetical protein
MISCVNVSEKQLLGKWKVMGSTSNNEEFKKAVRTFEGYIYTFKQNGVLVYNDKIVKYHFKDGITGTWTLESNELNVEHTLDLGSAHIKITDKDRFYITEVSKDKMTWEMRFDDGNVFTLYVFRRE